MLRGNMVTNMVLQKSLNVRQYSLAQILWLHLLPGLLIAFVFSAIAAVMSRFSLPASLALLITWLVAGMPIELGILLHQGWQQNGHLSLKGIVLYRESLPHRQYLWLVPVLLVWTTIISTIFVPLSESLRQALFWWWPDWLILSNFVQSGKTQRGSLHYCRLFTQCNGNVTCIWASWFTVCSILLVQLVCWYLFWIISCSCINNIWGLLKAVSNHSGPGVRLAR